TLLLHHQSHRQPRFLLQHFVKRPVPRRNHCRLRTVMWNRYPQVSPRFNSSASPKRTPAHLFAAARALHPRITIVPFQLVTSHPSDHCEEPSTGHTCSLVSTRPFAWKSGTYPITKNTPLCEIPNVSHTRIHEAPPKHCSIDRPVRFDRAPLRVTGQLIGKNLAFFKSDNPKIWYALAGADLETQPGTYDLSVRAIMPGGRVARSLKKVEIAAGSFSTGTVNVPENFVEPDAESQKKIAADQLVKTRAFSHFLAAPQWSGDFVTPVQAKPTDSFGMTHIFNEE